jgi:hypothetical protein
MSRGGLLGRLCWTIRRLTREIWLHRARADAERLREEDLNGEADNW